MITRYLFSLLSLSLIACGGGPRPVTKVKETPKTWSALTPTPQGEGETPTGFEGALSLEVWLAEPDTPSVERLEKRLSQSSVLANVNGSNNAYTLSMGEMSCEATWSDEGSKTSGALKERRGERAGLCAPQLKASQSALVAQAKGLVSLSCAVKSTVSALDALKVAHSVARDLEAIFVNVTKGSCALLERPQRFDIKDFVRVLEAPLPNERVRVCTQGLEGFGQREVCLMGVIKARAQVAQEALLAVADSATRGAPVYEGGEASRGPATALLTPSALFNQHLGEAIGEAPSGALVAVSPKGTVDDAKAHHTMMMRFTLP
jgi:hypothetical protein